MGSGLNFVNALIFISVVSVHGRKSWRTLRGAPPLIVARGGSSGLFPEQTVEAYSDALKNSIPGIALFCDLQLSKDGVGICRTDFNLQKTTNIDQLFRMDENNYSVNGAPVKGWFSVDFPSSILLNNITAKQPVSSRAAVFDGLPIATPEDVHDLLQRYNNYTGFRGFLWLNVESPSFYLEHNMSMNSYLKSLKKTKKIIPDYISSTDIGFLNSLEGHIEGRKTKLVFRIPDMESREPSTNKQYKDLASNMTNIRNFASGILVRKDYIWPVDDAWTRYLQPHTTLVRDAHFAYLQIYAFYFNNDQYHSSFNYSYDPVKEYLNFITVMESSVDGVVTDFPVTASEAIACFAHPEAQRQIIKQNKKSRKHQLIISHNGDSGDYPGETRMAYQAAINIGVDYIDCAVQMTKDNVPICREDSDLYFSTNVATTRYTTLRRIISQFDTIPGVYTFDLNWTDVSTLRAVQNSPEAKNNMRRDAAYDNTQSIMNFSDFLELARNHSTGVYIRIQHGYVLNATMNIDVVGAVLSALQSSGMGKSDVYIQSEDHIVLRYLKQKQVPYNLVYEIRLTDSELETGVLVTDRVIKSIKEFAGAVVIPKQMIATMNTKTFFLKNSTNIVPMFQHHNISVFVNQIRNEFVTLAFDYQADPHLELNAFLRHYKVDGVVTDFPATAKPHLKNACIGGTFMNFTFPMVLPSYDTENSTSAQPLQIEEPLLPQSPEISPSPSVSAASESSSFLKFFIIIVIASASNFL